MAEICYHCSHFLATTFDFTTFSTQAFEGHTIFSHLAVCFCLWILFLCMHVQSPQIHTQYNPKFVLTRVLLHYQQEWEGGGDGLPFNVSNKD